MNEDDDDVIPGAEVPVMAQPAAANSSVVPEGDKAGGDKDGAVADEKHEKLSPELQAKLDLRIGKEVSKRKSLETEVERLKRENEEFRAKASETENAKYAHLGVDPDLIESDDRSTLDAAMVEQANAEQQARAWGKYTEDGLTVGGKEYTAAECREFEKYYTKLLGKAEGVVDAVVSKARKEQKRLLLKGKEIDRKDALEKSGSITLPKVPAKAKEPEQPETTAPGSAAIPKDGGGKVPTLPPKTQDQAKAWLNGTDD